MVTTRRISLKKPAPKAPPAKPPQASTPVAAKGRSTAAPATRPAAPVAGDPKPEKARKLKLVRDSFTIPKPEYLVLEALKQRAALAGSPAKKSELLRAGIKALADMGDGPFLAALGAVPAIKTGRPAKA